MGRPVPAEVFDRDYAAGCWDLLFADEETPRNRTVADLIAGVAPHPTVLDIGCGSGRLAQLLAPVGPPARYVGLDLSRAALQRAQALGLGGCEFVHGDFETWLPTERFDVVVFNESIGYARDPAATVRRFSGCLISPGGLVVSYYRSGNYTAIWRRVAGVAETIQAVVVRNARGAIWDIRLLRQRVRGGIRPLSAAIAGRTLQPTKFLPITHDARLPAAAPRRVLLVSPHFPPINAPDHQRVRMSLPYYAKLGWNRSCWPSTPTMCGHPRGRTVRDVSENRPRRVLSRVVVALDPLVRHWQSRLARLVAFPADRYPVAATGAVRSGVFLQHAICHLCPRRDLALAVRRALRDRHPGSLAHQLLRATRCAAPAGRTEVSPGARGRPTGRETDLPPGGGFVSVSPQYLDDLAHRYPWFAAKPQATIRFGTTPEDFAAARRLTNVEHTLPRQPGEVHLLYTGAAGPIMPHAINVLLEGLRRFRASHPAPAARLRLHFWGRAMWPRARASIRCSRSPRRDRWPIW